MPLVFLFLINLFLPIFLAIPLSCQAIQLDIPTYRISDCTGLNILNISPWPGRGVQIYVNQQNSLPGKAHYFFRHGEIKAPLVSKKVTPPVKQYAAILFDFDRETEQFETLNQTAAAFISQLTHNFQIALFIKRSGIYQLSGFTSDRDRLTEILKRTSQFLQPVDDDNSTAISLSASIKYMSDIITATDRFEQERIKALVVIGNVPSSQKDKISLNNGLPVLHLSREAPPANIQKLAEELNAKPAQIDRIGICLGSNYDEKITLEDDRGNHCTFLPPLRPVEEDLLPCDEADIVTNRRSQLRTITLDISGDEKEKFERMYAKKRKGEFKLSVKLENSEPIRAKANLRGRSSLQQCSRKSFSINLNGRVPRNYDDTVLSDKFYLITTCSKAEGFKQYTANLLARQIGVFPLSFQYVELIVNNENWGVYLLVNNAIDELLATSALSTTILRRRYEWTSPSVSVEVPAGKMIHDQVFSDYRDLMHPPEHLSGEQLFQWLTTRMDLPKFLDLIALQTALANGDWIDEVFFYSEQAFLDTDVGNYYHVSTWDMDDLFKKCHKGGKYELNDPNRLTYCLEGKLEKRLMRDPYIYDLYIQRLEGLLDGTLHHSSVKRVLDTTFQDLSPFLTEPSRRDNIRNHMDIFYDDYRKRERVLRERIHNFRTIDQ